MLIIIFVCALVIRLLYVLQSKAVDPLFYQPIMDALYHHEWAVTIAEGNWLGSEAFFRAPGYPYFLGFLYTIFGINMFVARIVQIIIGAANCVLTAKIGTQLFKKKIGTIAGFIACAYPLLVYFDNELLIPTLLTFFILLSFYFMFTQKHKVIVSWRWLVNGVTWGLAAITRPNILLFLIYIPVWLAKTMKKNWKPAVLFGIIGVLVIILPVTIRNFVVSKEFVLIAWQGGTNFYIGNNSHSDGFTALVPGTRKTWWGGFHDAKRLAEQTLNKQLKNSEIDRFWLGQGLNFMKEKPFKALYLTVKKAYLFFAGYEISNNRDIYFFSRLTFLKFFIINAPFFQFPFGLLFPLSLVGMFLFFRKSRSGKYDRNKQKNIVLILGCIVSYAISFIVFFICARYRIPIIPFYIIFACSAIVYGIDRLKKKQFKSLYIPMLVFVISYLFFNANIFNIKQTNPGLNYCTLGVAYKNQGDIDKAVVCYNTAIKVDPDQAEAYYNLGNVYAQNRRFAEAKELYLKAIDRDPLAARAYSNLGNIYFETEKMDSALMFYAKAMDLEPDYETPYCHAGLVYVELGEIEKARALWQRYLQINPNSTRTRALLESLP